MRQLHNAGSYLRDRKPQLHERVEVTNEHNHFYKQWGKVIEVDDKMEAYKVLINETDFEIWFARLEIAWDSGH